VLVFEFTDYDLTIQELAFDRGNLQWALSRHDEPWAFLLYEAPKVLVMIVASLMFLLGLGTKSLRDRLNVQRRAALFVPVCILLAMATVGAFKALSGIYCPSQLTHFGGSKPYLRLLEQMPPEAVSLTRGRCFPAAHPSTLFALASLAFAWPHYARSALLLSFTLGWLTGTYQLLRGAHFFSHTLVTMLWVLTLVWCLARAFRLTLYRDTPSPSVLEGSPFHGNEVRPQ
jgi:membrane-associated PAP2 superfamily phosphatase